MNGATSVSVLIDGKTITLESGLLARQAAGSVIARIGDTMVFSAVTVTNSPREGIDYFPLQVEYRDKYYAAGRFPGGFFKRETKPSEKEVLTARLTDRPIRPMFPAGYRNDVQMNNMLISADAENESDILSINAASASLMVSEIPFMGPIAAVRVGRIAGKFVINPTHSEREKSDLDLIYASTRDLPLMIEGSSNEISEKDMVAAMKAAHAECVKLCDAQIELRKKLGLPDKIVTEADQDQTLINAAREICGVALNEALLTADKQTREGKINAIIKDLKEKMALKFPTMTAEQFRSTFDEVEIGIVRKNVIERSKRIDGRAFDEIRPLSAQVGILPRTHGSAIFNRGETQSLGSVTLGTKSDTQGLDAITGGPLEKKFMLHYNFPPYSTGEVGRLGNTGRREIGHGALAERSLAPVIPQDYPYTVRLVSDVMGSNGSSSMASICVGTLSMMDAGIPITKPVAGISVGLFSDKSKACLVIDILGAEDHCGDMDFKVAGTREGITGFQVDLKIRGLSWDLVEKAFEMARTARGKILDFMATVLSEPRSEMSAYAPRHQVVRINPEKIGQLIGPGGKNIRRITETTGAQIDIDDDGTVTIFTTSAEAHEMALAEISAISAEAEIDKIYDGTVTGIKEFGAFVEILPGLEGLCHISELADFRVKSVEDICRVGDKMWVKCIAIDDRGRVKLSRREAMREKDGKEEGKED